MVSFSALIQKFKSKGEKTGWTYVEISEAIAHTINPNIKKSYRVKGSINETEITGIAILPMGNGSFILVLNKELRKQTNTVVGQQINLQLELDTKGYELNADFVACLQDEPQAAAFFNTLTNGHKNYFSKWIDGAKTPETQAKRIAQSVNALAKNWGYPEMIRNAKKQV